MGDGGMEKARAHAQQKDPRAGRLAGERQTPRGGKVERARIAPYLDQHRAKPGAARALQRRLQRLHVAACAGDDEIGRINPVFMQARSIRTPGLQRTEFRANPQNRPGLRRQGRRREAKAGNSSRVAGPGVDFMHSPTRRGGKKRSRREG